MSSSSSSKNNSGPASFGEGVGSGTAVSTLALDFVRETRLDDDPWSALARSSSIVTIEAVDPVLETGPRSLLNDGILPCVACGGGGGGGCGEATAAVCGVDVEIWVVANGEGANVELSRYPKE